MEILVTFVRRCFHDVVELLQCVAQITFGNTKQINLKLLISCYFDINERISQTFRVTCFANESINLRHDKLIAKASNRIDGSCNKNWKKSKNGISDGKFGFLNNFPTSVVCY